MNATFPRSLKQWIIVLIIVMGFWGCRDSRMDEAVRVVNMVEGYQRTHSRLPDSLGDIGLKEDESGPIYYQKNDDRSYTVWYGLSLGESEVYDSRTRTWSHHP